MFGRKSAAASTTQAAPQEVKNGKGQYAPVQVAEAARPTTDADDAQRRSMAVAQMSMGFAQVVSVLMRSPSHKHLALTDLEWLVIPPLLRGQWSVVSVKPKQGGAEIPAAVALWATVSSEADKRLSETLNAPIRLRPDEWQSGENLWLIETVGDMHVVGTLMRELSEKAFKGRSVKMRVRGTNGKVEVRTLADLVAAKAQQPSAVS